MSDTEIDTSQYRPPTDAVALLVDGIDFLRLLDDSTMASLHQWELDVGPAVHPWPRDTPDWLPAPPTPVWLSTPTAEYRPQDRGSDRLRLTVRASEPVDGLVPSLTARSTGSQWAFGVDAVATAAIDDRVFIDVLLDATHDHDTGQSVRAALTAADALTLSVGVFGSEDAPVLERDVTELVHDALEA